MATLEIPSNVKCITSGQVPTTTNLKDGEFAFGKVGGVAKLYGNVNGVIIDFTGDGGGGTIDVNALLALLSSGNGITIVNDIANDKAEVNVDPRYITFSQSLDINPNGTATEIYITDEPSTGYYEFTSDHAGEIRYNANASNDTMVLQSGAKGNVKTLFGNQSIYGSGNIDLYRHTVTITVVGGTITFSEISSNNLQIGSLTDLKTVFGDSFNFGARGSVRGSLVDCVTADGYYSWYLGVQLGEWVRQNSPWAIEQTGGPFTFTDVVTTV